MSEPSLTINCECGNTYSLHTATVCPRCYQWPRDSRNAQVRKAFDMIARVNTVSILSLDEMESVVNRALSGEFDNVHLDEETDDVSTDK